MEKDCEYLPILIGKGCYWKQSIYIMCEDLPYMAARFGQWKWNVG